MCRAYTLVSREFSISMPLVDALVSYLTPVMELHTLYQFMRVTLSPMLFRESSLLVVT